MSAHMVFQNCSLWQKEMIRSYWSRKLPRVEQLLHCFPEDQRELRLTVKRKPDRFDMHAVLLLPTGTLVAQGSSHMDSNAIDAVIDRLTKEVRRHKGMIRHDDLHRRTRHRREAANRAAGRLAYETPA